MTGLHSENASNKSSEQLIQALRSFVATKNSLETAVLQLLEDCEFDLKAEFQLLKKAMQSTFQQLDLQKENAEDRYPVNNLVTCFNLIMAARERYSDIVGQEFWLPYLQTVRQHAVKHFQGNSVGIAQACSVEECQEALHLLEAISGILPDNQIETYRGQCANAIRALLLETTERLYGVDDFIDKEKLLTRTRQQAEEYHVELPTEEEYWQLKMAKILEKLQYDLANLGDDEKAYFQMERDLKKARTAIDAKNIDQIQIGEETKQAIVFLNELQKSFEYKFEEFKERKLIARFHELLQTMLTDVASHGLNGMSAEFRRVIHQLEERNLPHMADIVADIIAIQIDPLLDTIAERLKIDKTCVGQLGSSIALLGDIRNRLTKLLPKANET